MPTVALEPITDFNYPANELLVQLFNRATGRSFTVEQFRFGVPGATIASNYNTELTLYGQQDRGVFGKSLVRYNRLPINVILNDNTNIIYWHGEHTVAELLEQINAKYRIRLSVCEIENQNLPEIDPDDPNARASFALNLKPDHLVFYGNVVLELRNMGVDLSSTYPLVQTDDFTAP